MERPECSAVVELWSHSWQDCVQGASWQVSRNGSIRQFVISYFLPVYVISYFLSVYKLKKLKQSSSFISLSRITIPIASLITVSTSYLEWCLQYFFQVNTSEYFKRQNHLSYLKLQMIATVMFTESTACFLQLCVWFVG